MSDSEAPQAPESLGLDALAAQAVELEAGALPPELRPAAEPTMAEKIDEAGDLVELGWSVVGPMLADRYADAYGERQRQNIARTWAKLAEKHGWDVEELVGKWGPELAFVAAVLGPALPVFIADKRAKRDAAEGAQRQPEAAEGVRP